MRGGTSKAAFFHAEDLPADTALRDKVILSALGSPDRRQIDGLGGGSTSTSKVAIIQKSTRPDADVDYDFGQVDLLAPIVGKTMNCGNISSAVGPFAVDERIVDPVEPFTTVRIYNRNTDKMIIATVPVKDGTAMTEGDFSIDGVPGTGAKISLDFVKPQGAVSGVLLPTGNAKDYIEIAGRTYAYSLVDAANPVVFVHPEDFGVTGTEIPSEFHALPNCSCICKTLEIIRGTCAIRLGLAKDLEDARCNSQTLPKIAFISTPRAYTAGSGKYISAEQIDCVGRLFSMNMKMIDAYMGTGTICTIVAANTPGTIVNELLCGTDTAKPVPQLRIGHPWGVIETSVKYDTDSNGTRTIYSARLDRTARRIMDGYVYVRG